MNLWKSHFPKFEACELLSFLMNKFWFFTCLNPKTIHGKIVLWYVEYKSTSQVKCQSKIITLKCVAASHSAQFEHALVYHPMAPMVFYREYFYVIQIHSQSLWKRDKLLLSVIGNQRKFSFKSFESDLNWSGHFIQDEHLSKIYIHYHVDQFNFPLQSLNIQMSEKMLYFFFFKHSTN